MLRYVCSLASGTTSAPVCVASSASAAGSAAPCDATKKRVAEIPGTCGASGRPERVKDKEMVTEWFNEQSCLQSPTLSGTSLPAPGP